jgi:hypothetical protein
MCKIAHLALNYLFTHSLAGGRWFFPGTLGTKNKTDRRDMTEILLKVAIIMLRLVLSFAFQAEKDYFIQGRSILDPLDLAYDIFIAFLNAMTIIQIFLSCLLFFYETNWDIKYNLFSPLECWSRQISLTKREA